MHPDRSKKPPARDRENRLRVGVNPIEREIIARRAKDAGKAVAAYLRECAIGQPPRPIIHLEVARSLLQLATEIDDAAIKSALIQMARRLQ